MKIAGKKTLFYCYENRSSSLYRRKSRKERRKERGRKEKQSKQISIKNKLVDLLLCSLGKLLQFIYTVSYDIIVKWLSLRACDSDCLGQISSFGTFIVPDCPTSFSVPSPLHQCHRNKADKVK